MKAPFKLQYKIEIFMCYVALMYKYYFDGVNWFDVMLWET